MVVSPLPSTAVYILGRRGHHTNCNGVYSDDHHTQAQSTELRYNFSIKASMVNIDNYFLIRYVNLNFNNAKCLLKPVICEGRQLSEICHIKAVMEGFPNKGTFTFL